MHYYLIDSENGAIADSWIDLLETAGPDDQFLVFYTEKSPHMSYKSIVKLKQSPVQPTFMECENGTDNALDFQLATYLGSLIANNPDDTYTIISGDKGFDVIVRFWENRNIAINRDSLAKKNPSITNEIDESNEELPVLTETADASYDEAEVGTLLSCIGKDDLSRLHNILKLIYGEKEGKAIYTQVKKSDFEVKKVNWQKKTKFKKYLQIVFAHKSISISDDFFKNLYQHKNDLKQANSSFVKKYGQTDGTTYYNIYKPHSEYIKKFF